MSKALTTFFISLALMSLIITLSLLLIDNMTVLLSILLLEIVIFLAVLVLIQAMFIGQRQVYTTKKMLKNVKKIVVKPSILISYFNTIINDFHTQRLSNHAILYIKTQAESLFYFKKKTYLSILHLTKPLKLNDILSLHENNLLHQNHKIRILVTILETNENLENFLHTIIYDHTTKPTQYHIPVFVNNTHMYIFDETKYLAHPDLKSIITYINTTIKKPPY
jgi:hypothetical protein